MITPSDLFEAIRPIKEKRAVYFIQDPSGDDALKDIDNYLIARASCGYTSATIGIKDRFLSDEMNGDWADTFASLYKKQGFNTRLDGDRYIFSEKLVYVPLVVISWGDFGS